ncbi:MAG TPA: glycosyltransferase family 4 protein [Stellaceae bacterium]|jgi:glycosyltransferase involved in cell wall biosynthesis
MRVILVSTAVPVMYGGARFIVDWLELVLKQYGHQVETVYLPAVDHSDTRYFEQMLNFRLCNLAEFADRIITFRPPSHMVQHPCKVMWFIHHLRVFYDVWHVYRPVPDTAYWRAYRARLMAADRVALSEAHRVFTNSLTVSERVKNFNGVDTEVLYPPLMNPERFYFDSYGDEIVCVCRFEHHKRQYLLAEAMRHVRTPVRLRLCGASTEALARVEAVAEEIPAGRVTIEARWISEEEKAERLASALAIAYVPIEEDGYGYPVLEAAHARKASIVTDDGGAVREFVRDGVEGFVLPPDPKAIAEIFDRLWSDRKLAARLGDGAAARIDELGIGWPRVVERLLS